MHDRAEMRAGAATRATASATEIMILLNIGYVIAHDTPRVESFDRLIHLMLRTLIFSVQDHRRHGVMLGVAEGDPDGGDAALFS